MTEPDPPHAADPAPETPTTPEDMPPPPRRKRRAAPWLGAVGFLLLAAAIGFVWQSRPPPATPDATLAALPAQVRALETRVAQLAQRLADTPDLAPLTARVAALEQRPAGGVDLQPLMARLDALERRPAATADLAPLTARVDALAQRPTTTTDLAPLTARVAALEQRPAAVTDLSPLTGRIDALERRRGPDLAPLEARIAALEQKLAADNQVAARVDALSGRMDALSGRGQSADAQLGERLTAAEARLAALDRNVAQVAAETQRTTRLARIQAALAALAAGQKLGEIAGAPPAVARFATTAPPTEAALRLGFPKAEEAALQASRPQAAGQPFFSRILARAEDLVTVRQGDRVLLGDRAAGVLARARDALDAGDLAGAVAAIASLPGPSAEAMARWRADATAVLDARTALADMAAQP